MITVCLDTTITQSKCSRYTFRPFDFAPSQAKAISPYLVNKVGKKWFIAFADYAWGQSTKDAYVEEIKKNGGQVVNTMGIPLGTADMTAFLSKITGEFDGLFGIFFGPQGISFVTQSFDLGLSKKARIAGDGAIAVATSLPAMAAKANGFLGIDRYVPVLEGQFNTPYHKKFLDDSVARLKPLGVTLPDRYVQSNYEGVNALKVGMANSKFRGREDTMKLIEALLEMKESDDFPQGDKLLRKEDHQAFVREFIFEVQNGAYKILEIVPKEKTVVPPACTFKA
jgi:branched-chain amino acid transport system substrate-binding protein